MLGVIDLLIVEEAGQVSVDLCAPSLALASRAIVVGDKDQIQPVWSIDSAIDGGNARQRGLDPKDLSKRGLTASEDSMMTLARATSAVTSEGEAGLFLADHWRCRAGVIAFCNELVYRRRLIPKRPDEDSPLPPLGYAHIPGHSEPNGTGWQNSHEAMVIAKWLKTRREDLLGHYSAETLANVVAIVTPFKAQVKVLKKALKREGLASESMTVGTVHSLQGAERSVVLFSPVYDHHYEGGTFFDSGPNMLNVAVSRAKDSFLVFGAMDHFRANGSNAPSSVLASLLYTSPENEITDIEPIIAPDAERSKGHIERVASLEKHKEVLKQAVTTAARRVLIVSPFLSNHAIDSDGLAPLIKGARQRGVTVHVVTDLQLNRDSEGRQKSAAKTARKILETAGAEVSVINGIHSKTLAVDSDWIVEGSFNWLSAVRDRNSTWRRSEASLSYRGPEAPHMIELSIQAIERKKKKESGKATRQPRPVAAE